MRSFTISLVLFSSILFIGAGSPLSELPLLSFPAPVEFLVKGDTQVKIGDTVILTPENSEGCSITWTPVQGIELIEKMVQTKEPRDVITDDLQFVGLPVSSLVLKPSAVGVIRFQCTAINWDERQFHQVIHSITVAGENGPPDDQLDPEDDDTPNGWVKSDYLVLVYESETSQISPEVAQLIGSKLWLRDIKDAGLNRPLIYDKDSDEAKILIDNAKKTGTESNVPFMAVMSDTGEFKRTMPVLFGDDLRKELGL